MTARYYKIPWPEFKAAIAGWGPVPFTDKEYTFDWKKEGDEWVQKPAEIKELCFKIPLSAGYCIKLYTTFDRTTNECRDKDEDSIKIVAARLDTLKPIRGRLTHTKRIRTWQQNFLEHVRELLIDVGGNDLKCPDCGAPRVIKHSTKNKANFLGCSAYKPAKPCRTASIVVRS